MEEVGCVWWRVWGVGLVLCKASQKYVSLKPPLPELKIGKEGRRRGGGGRGEMNLVISKLNLSMINLDTLRRADELDLYAARGALLVRLWFSLAGLLRLLRGGRGGGMAW